MIPKFRDNGDIKHFHINLITAMKIWFRGSARQRISRFFFIIMWWWTINNFCWAVVIPWCIDKTFGTMIRIAFYICTVWIKMSQENKESRYSTSREKMMYNNYIWSDMSFYIKRSIEHLSIIDFLKLKTLLLTFIEKKYWI